MGNDPEETTSQIQAEMVKETIGSIGADALEEGQVSETHSPGLRREAAVANLLQASGILSKLMTC